MQAGEENENPEEDQDSSLFSLSDEELAGDGCEEVRGCSRISASSPPLAVVTRVFLSRDRAYAVGFVVCTASTLVLGFTTLRVPNKHHYILSILGALLLSGSLNVLLIVSHYWGVDEFVGQSKVAIPLEGIALLILSTCIVLEGWSFAIAIVPLAIATFDILRLSRTESLQFTTVLLDLASELFGKKVRRILLVFLAQNIWLVVWTSVLVDVASSSHATWLKLMFLLFVLAWSTEVARNLIAFHVTSLLAFRIVLEQEANQSVEEVDAMLQRRAFSVSFGSVCFASLWIGPANFWWTVSTILCREKDRGISANPQEEGSRQPSSFFANNYAWPRVGLRGETFQTASRLTWSHMTSGGVDRAIAQEMAENVLSSWSKTFGALNSILALACLPRSTQETSEILFLFTFASFVFGSSNAGLLLEPLRSSLVAVFISFAEKPDSLRKWPIVHHRLSRTSHVSLESWEESES